MRKMGFIAALVVAMTAVSCVQEMNTEIPAPETSAITFDATFDASATKAVLDGTTGKVAWEASDQVSIMVGDGNYLYTATQGGATTTLTTQAEGVPSEGTYYAVFPYDEAAAMAGENLIATTLPAEQTAVLGSFTTHLAVAQTTDTKLAFKNVCGLVKVNIDAENVTKIVFQGNSDEIVAGGINVTVSDAPLWAAVDGQGATSVTLLPAKDQTSLAKGDYYFAVLPQTFAAGFKVTAYKGDESWVIRNVMASTEIKRAGVVAGKSFFEIEGNGTEDSPYILKTPQDMVNMRTLATLGGETWFKMANSIDMAGVTNYIPVNYDQNYERKIHFDGGNFTLSNFTCNDDNCSYPSVFGVLYGTCKDLKITNAAITSQGQVAGILGGYVGTKGKPATVTNVSVQGTVTSDVDRVGGMAGVVYESIFEDCYAEVVVSTAKSDAAGFAGKIQGETSFVRCKVKAEVTSTASEKNRTGAFAGWVDGTTVTFEDCEVLEGSTVTDNPDNATGYLGFNGGLIGYAGSSVRTVIKKCSVNVLLDMPNARCVGGLIAYAAAGEVEISGASVSGTIVGNQYVAGLIGSFTENATTLTIDGSNSDASVTGTVHYVAGLVGNIDKGTKTIIIGSHSAGAVKSGGSSIAGLVGAISAGTLMMEDCYATGNVSGNNNTGGLVGNLSVNGSVEKCYYKTGVVSGNGTTGGLFGAAKISTLTDCYVEADVKGKANGVGGLMGNTATNTMTMTGCHYSGNMTTAGNAGGLFGRCEKAPIVSRCYSEGTLTATANVSNIGGLLGYPTGATLTDSWSSMDVTAGGQAIGGLVGMAAAPVTMSRCYSTGNVKGRASTGGLVGMSYNNADGNVFEDSIFWGTVINTKTVQTQYASGAIVGCVHTKTATGQNCWRGANVTLSDYEGVYEGDITYANPLVDHDDFIESLPPYIAGIPSTATNAFAQRPYHGKAAGAEETLSQVASRIGWSEDIWDLSGDVPAFK